MEVTTLGDKEKLKKHSLNIIKIVNQLEKATNNAELFTVLATIEFFRFKLLREFERGVTNFEGKKEAANYIN